MCQLTPFVLFLISLSLKGPSSEACLLPRTSLPPAAALPRKGSMKSAAAGVQVPSKPPPTSPLRLPKDCHRSLGDLKVSLKTVDRRYRSNKHFPCTVCLLDCCLTVYLLIFLFFPQVTRGLVARFLQRSKRNLSLSSEHAGSTGQGPKRRSGAEGTATNHLPFEQVRQQVLIELTYFTPFSSSRHQNSSVLLRVMPSAL